MYVTDGEDEAAASHIIATRLIRTVDTHTVDGSDAHVGREGVYNYKLAYVLQRTHSYGTSAW